MFSMLEGVTSPVPRLIACACEGIKNARRRNSRTVAPSFGTPTGAIGFRLPKNAKKIHGHINLVVAKTNTSEVMEILM
jgi:hypothetical protein